MTVDTRVRKIKEAKSRAHYSSQMRQLSDLEREAVRRGRDIERLIKILAEWRDKLPEGFRNACRNSLDRYVTRNTTKSTYKRTKAELDWL